MALVGPGKKGSTGEMSSSGQIKQGEIYRRRGTELLIKYACRCKVQEVVWLSPKRLIQGKESQIGPYTITGHVKGGQKIKSCKKREGTKASGNQSEKNPEQKNNHQVKWGYIVEIATHLKGNKGTVVCAI